MCMSDMHGRSQERLLRALLDTAADFTALQDVEDVLQAIVRRTRALTGTDMTYVSINDPDRRETSIRQSDGVATAAYRTLKMPLGTGILGQIATGLAPYQSADYLEDQDLKHVPRVDEIVRAEGVRAIMGVPLTIHGRVIGALVVAERHSRRFTTEEIDLVDSIGTHAAVALDNSMRFEATERLTRELEARQRQMTVDIEHLQSVRDLDRELMDVVMVSPDVQELLRVGAAALGLELRVVSTDGIEVSAAPDGRTSSSVGSGDPEAVVPLRAGADEIGHLVSPGPASEADLLLLERVAVHAALALLFSRAAEDADLRRQSELIDDLLSQRNLPREHVERRMRRWGLDPSKPVHVVMLTPPLEDRRPCLRALRGASARSVAIDHGSHICLVTTDAGWEPAVRRVFDDRRWRLQAGAAATVAGLDGLPDTHRTAELALGTLVNLDRGGVAEGTDLGFLGALLGLDQRGDLPRPLTSSVSPLVDYDRRRGTDLVRTALTYLDSDSNVIRTAELLHVHRNTVRQRLDRLSSLLGPDWNRSPRRLETHLALQVLSARDSRGTARR